MKLVMSAMLAVIVFPLFTGIYDYFQEQKDMNQADKAVTLFIKASAEGSDKLKRKVLMKDAQGILDDSYHAFPGNAKKMGNRYAFKRFANDYDKKHVLYYYIEYYHPANDTVYADNIKMVKDTDGKWKSTTLTGLREETMRSYIEGHEQEGVLVHSYKREGVTGEN